MVDVCVRLDDGRRAIHVHIYARIEFEASVRTSRGAMMPAKVPFPTPGAPRKTNRRMGPAAATAMVVCCVCVCVVGPCPR